MKTKKCFKCGVEQELDNFYKHKQMGDGHLNKCKTCTKKDVKGNYVKNIEIPGYIEKERARGREKYERLMYKEKYKEALKCKRETPTYKERMSLYAEKRSWTKRSSYKDQNRNLKLAPGVEAHHWNYNDEYLKDILPLPIKLHRRIHREIVLDLEKKIFKTLTGEYLDTKEKHLQYISQFVEIPQLSA